MPIGVLNLCNALYIFARKIHYLSITSFLYAFTISLDARLITTWMITRSIVLSCGLDFLLCITCSLGGFTSGLLNKKQNRCQLKCKKNKATHIYKISDEAYSLSSPNMLPQVLKLIFPQGLDKKVSSASQHALIDRVNWILSWHHCIPVNKC